MAGSSRGAPAIGIDLGTTYSCVAVWKYDRIEIIANDQGNRITPSCVAFTHTERLIGDGANNQISRNPTNTVYDSKRIIGRRFSDGKVIHDMKLWPFKVVEGPNDAPRIVVTYKGQEKQFSAEEISSMVLTKMKEVAETYIGESVKNAVITVPAYFNDCQRQATKDAAAIAGLNVVRLINEPTAAAIAYGVDNRSGLTKTKTVLVFDLGGGTFDVSLLTIGKGGTFEVKAVAGDTHLGGQDFDNRLVAYCVKDFKKKWNKDLTGNERAMGRLKVACERAKRSVSYAVRATIELDMLHEGIDFSMNLTRAKFDELNMDFFSECMNKLETCLTDAKTDKRSVDEVILVGGSTRIPKIKSMLQEFFNGKKLCQSINPDEAVAYGAAIMAANLCGDSTTKLIKDLVLMDVTPLSIGTGIVGDIMHVVIPRHTPIPTRKTDTFVTAEDNQPNMEIKIYQGERARSTNNYFLGQFTISGIPLAPRGVPIVEDTYEIDANGILTVTAKEVSTGRTKTLVVTNHSGRLSNQEIQKMINDAEKFKIEDQEYKRKVDARNALEDCLYDLKNKIRAHDIGMNQAPAALMNIIQAIADTTVWLSNDRTATVNEFEAKKKRLEFLSRLAFSN